MNKLGAGSYSVVLDCDCLINFTNLAHYRLLEATVQVFDTIHIPSKVFQEYETGLRKDPRRSWLLQRLKPEGKGYRLCTAYDTVTKAILAGEKYINEGEAEALAQQLKVFAHLLISDDKKFVKALQNYPAYKQLRIWQSLHLIAWFDLAGFLPNYTALMKDFYHLAYKFKSLEVRTAYREVASFLGVNISQKILSQKSSLKIILK